MKLWLGTVLVRPFPALSNCLRDMVQSARKVDRSLHRSQYRGKKVSPLSQPGNGKRTTLRFPCFPEDIRAVYPLKCIAHQPSWTAVPQSRGLDSKVSLSFVSLFTPLGLFPLFLLFCCLVFCHLPLSLFASLRNPRLSSPSFAR